MGRRRVGRTRLAALAMTGLVTLGAAGCGGGADAEESATSTEQPAVTGVVHGPDGAPIEGVDLELMVWPAPQSTGETPQLVRADETTSAADGSFSLTALASELTPHAETSGRVGVEVRVVGSDGPGTRTAVSLTRAADTGVTTVNAINDLVVVAAGS